jgi:hypothetical protein
MLNFNGVLLGCSLTDNAEQEFNDQQPWTITASEHPDPQEGHDIHISSSTTRRLVRKRL